ncbi:Transposase family Tnp2 protein [Ceratobasidium sp. AG-Ba]|nr:Transposase family Tnp2 protein [Ceratobasidium sp. AG-Ba]
MRVTSFTSSAHSNYSMTWSKYTLRCPHCSPRRAALLAQAVAILLANRRRSPALGPRHYHRRYAPQSPPPRLPLSPPPPQRTSRKRQQPESRSCLCSPQRLRVDNVHKDDPDFDIDAELARLRHPNFCFYADSDGLANQNKSPAGPCVVEDIPDPAMRRLLVDHLWLKGLMTSNILQMRAIGDLAKSNRFWLFPGDMKLIRAFNYKVDTDISGRAFSKLPQAFPDELGDLPSEQVIRNRASFLSAFDPILVECCVNSCLAYTGSNDTMDACPHCRQSCYKIDPTTGAAVPCWVFQYLPLIPRLVQMYRDPKTAHTLGYRARRQSSPNNFADIFDGAHYKALKQRHVMTEHERFQHCHFLSDTDIALGLTTDGFGPFKTRKQSCWPLLVFNYNLPPSIQYHLDNMLCLGVIPGRNEPKDLDTFLHPLVRELEELARGVAAYDGEHNRPFCLRAYLLACIGDMPAVAKLMCMKGPNCKYPCRACHIIGIRATKSTNSTKLGNTH